VEMKWRAEPVRSAVVLVLRAYTLLAWTVLA
jgi:hypothetical protein